MQWLIPVVFTGVSLGSSWFRPDMLWEMVSNQV
jgi:hypothetical protein